MLFQEYLKKEIFEIVKKLLEKTNLESDFLKKKFLMLNYRKRKILVICRLT